MALGACGGDDDEAGGGQATTTGETTAAKAIKVGLVTDIGQLNDRGFNQLAYEGLKRAERELGVEGSVVESASAADYVPNMRRARATRATTSIIGVGFAQGDAVDTVGDAVPRDAGSRSSTSTRRR